MKNITLYVLITIPALFLFLQISKIKNSNKSCNNEKTKLFVTSKLLNGAMKKIGQMSCKYSTNQVSTNGGWCSQISGSNSSSHVFDSSFAKGISQFLAGKNVASFGDGPGSYKEYIDKQGLLKSYDAYDGAPFAEDTTNGRVRFLDLSVPIYHLIEYDWLVSVEVAEHIPPEFETIYVENLVRHAKEGIILSWSRIGQGGLSHVNNRDPDYVKMKLESYGFYIDESASRRLRESARAPWIISNVNVYVRGKS